MKPLFALASACALLVATPVFACSEAEAEKMGKEVATKVASITQKNPQRARELNEQLRQRQEARSEQNRYRAIAMPTRRCSRNWIRKKATCSATLRSDPPVRGAAARDGGVRRP